VHAQQKVTKITFKINFMKIVLVWVQLLLSYYYLEILFYNNSFASPYNNFLYVIRIASPSEMGGIVSFLCSTDASYITGETIVAAGGTASRL
jgi:dehydrogenase/reductase SDR family protein 4